MVGVAWRTPAGRLVKRFFQFDSNNDEKGWKMKGKIMLFLGNDSRF